MEEKKNQVLIPAIQETIQFQEKPLVVVRLPNGEPGVVLRWMCENLHLATNAQVERIKRTEAIADDLIYARIQTDGGPQILATLVLRAVPYWLATIDTRRMEKSDPRRMEIVDYQRKVVDVLYTWASSLKEEAAPTSIVTSEPISKPISPGVEAGLDEWQAFYQQMLLWIDWQRDIANWQKSTDGRLDSLETVTGRILKQIGPARLTTRQQTLVQYYVSELSKGTNKPHSTIYAALKTAFRVPRYDEIPESEWTRVEQWFKQQFPGKHLPPTQASLFEQVEEE